MIKLLKWIGLIFLAFIALGMIIEANKTPEQKAAEASARAEQQAKDARKQQEPDDPDPAAQDFALTNEDIKTLDPLIASVLLTNTANNPAAYDINIDIKKDPFIGGASDWNSIANTTYNIGKILLEKQEVKEIIFIFWSTDSSNIDWARLIIKRSQLPNDWQQLTYLQFFGLSKPIPGTIESGEWICEFYGKYESARPNRVMPDFCLNSLN